MEMIPTTFQMVPYALWTALLYVFAISLARIGKTVRNNRLVLSIPVYKILIVYIAMAFTVLVTGKLIFIYYDPANGLNAVYGEYGALAACLLPFMACDLWVAGYLSANEKFRLPWDGMISCIIFYFAAAISLMGVFAFWEYYGKIEFNVMLSLSSVMFFVAACVISIIRVSREKIFLTDRTKSQIVTQTKV